MPTPATTYTVQLERRFVQTITVRAETAAEAQALAKRASFSECSEPTSDKVDILDVWEGNE